MICVLLAGTIQAGLAPTQAQQQAINTGNIATNAQGVAANKEGVAANVVQNASNKEQISANQGQIAANQQHIEATTERFSQLSEYDTKGERSHFSSPPEAPNSRQRIKPPLVAQLGPGRDLALTGYIIPR